VARGGAAGGAAANNNQSKGSAANNNNNSTSSESSTTQNNTDAPVIRSITPKQQAMLRESFDFLHRAREILEPKKFMRLIRALVAYDKGTKDISHLISDALEVLPPHESLVTLFQKFLPDAAQHLMIKSREAM